MDQVPFTSKQIKLFNSWIQSEDKLDHCPCPVVAEECKLYPWNWTDFTQNCEKAAAWNCRN